MRTIYAVSMLIATVLSVGGCGAFKLPDLPPTLHEPVVTVQSVELLDQSPEASRYMVHLTLENPNDYELPLTIADYTVTVSGAQYKGDTVPNRTLPASRSIDVKLPAVVAGSGGGSYQVSGSIEMTPPHEIRQLYYDIGVPRPRVPFAGQGPIGAAPAGE